MMKSTMLKPNGIVAIDQSRCLRMRFNKNSCTVCMRSCRLNTITIDNEVNIHRDTCSECMMCVSACPSGSFRMRAVNVHSLIARLRNIQAPVLSCHVRPGLVAHEKTPCLGFLSEEHLIALLFFLRKPLQINLTECKDCSNDFIVDVLRERLRSVAKKISMNVFEKLRIVENKADLNYKDVSYDRRGFFRALKNLTAREARVLFDDSHREECALSYSDKALPARRELLNRSFSVLPGHMRKRILEHYFYDIEVGETCNDCFACVGMCPTGALKSAEEDSETMLFFNSSLCTGCGLCGSFCRNNTVRMKEGFSGVLPFQFKGAKEASRKGDSEVHRGSHVEGAFAD
jgi:ferredoxin